MAHRREDGAKGESIKRLRLKVKLRLMWDGGGFGLVKEGAVR